MRWVEFDSTPQGIFHKEVLPEDKEFLLTHKDAFKRMWHEQTECYWVRLVVTLRSFVARSLYPDDFWEKIGCPKSYFCALLGKCYVNICQKFALGTFGAAQEFLSSILFVVANAGFVHHIGSKSIATDPFYSSCSRDAFRELFGDPIPTDKAQITAHATLPILSRFAAAVVELLRRWIRAGDATLLEFYRAYRRAPYWSQPVDRCPRDPLLGFLDEECYAWDCPGEEELFQILKNDPDQKKSLRDLAEILTDDEDEQLSDCEDDDAREEAKEFNLVLSVAEHLERTVEDIPLHDSKDCVSCAMWNFPLRQVVEEVQQQLLQEQSPSVFWKQDRIIRVLRKAERKFRREVKERGIVLRTDFKNVPKKKGKKKNRVPKEDVQKNAAAASGVPLQEKASAKDLVASTKKEKGNGAEKSVVGAGTGTPCDAGKTVTNGNAQQRKEKRCASCGRGEGIKLKRCALCVQKGYPEPVRYCSRECQVQDWEKRHQYVHEKDRSEDEVE